MKALSAARLFSDTVNVVKRFPMEVLFALAGTCAATINVELNDIQRDLSGLCIRVVLAANLGLLLSLSVSLISERRRPARWTSWVLRAVAVLLPVLFFTFIDPLERETDFFRFFLLSIGFHLLVAFVAFYGREEVNSFWQLNRTFFLRFLTGALYSAVLFLGLAAAIASISLLFSFNFSSNVYLVVWIWIVGMFQTLFFLSGVPADWEALENDQSYPKGLKMFTQFVLVPLASVYLLILLAYELKILIEWSLPKGMVSNLIIGYAVFGILSLLLVYPLRNLEDNKWIKSYSRSFYFLMVPLIVLLFLAIMVRVRSYGITEERYFLIVLAVWLTFVTVYFLTSRAQNIMIIPFSLCLIVLLSAYGPQSAFSVSRSSQLGELRDIFARHGALESGYLKPISAEVDSADGRRIHNILRYLVDKHGFLSLQPVIRQDLSAVSDSLESLLEKSRKKGERVSRWQMVEEQTDWLVSHVELPAVPGLSPSARNQISVQLQNSELISLGGADYMVELSGYRDSLQLKIADEALFVRSSNRGQKFSIRVGNETRMVSAETIVNAIPDPMLQAGGDTVLTAMATRYFPPEQLSETLTFRNYTARVLWRNIVCQNRGKKRSVLSGEAVLLLEKRD